MTQASGWRRWPGASRKAQIDALSRRALLQPHLEPIDVPVLMPLETGNSRIDAIYFIESGFASVVANGPGEGTLEVGIIGREGMTGPSVVLCDDRLTWHFVPDGVVPKGWPHSAVPRGTS